MADSTVEANAGTGGALFAVDQISGTTHPYVKIELGAAGEDNDPVHSSNPLPVYAPTPMSTYSVGFSGPPVSTYSVGFSGPPVSTYIVGQVGTVSTYAVAVVPGTGATNLGKARNAVRGATDTGVAMLAQYEEGTSVTDVANGDYEMLHVTAFGALKTEPEQHVIIHEMDASTLWGPLNNDAVNVTTTFKHVLGTQALTFDKVDGAGNTVFGAVSTAISSLNLGQPSPHDILQTVAYWSSVADINYAFLRLGTDGSNYNEWRLDGGDLTGAIFETLVFQVGDASHAGITGSGINWNAIDYCAVGTAFNAETDTLAGMIVDEISFHTNQHVNASINSEVQSSVNSANINLLKVGGSTTDKSTGNASPGTQRVVLATNQPTVSTYSVNASATSVQSTWAVGQSTPISTFAVNAAGAGVQSTWAIGQSTPISTFAVNAAGAGVQSTFAVGQNVTISTFAVNSAAPDGTQSTWALNKTSTHIAGQTGPVSTYSVSVPATQFVALTGFDLAASSFTMVGTLANYAGVSSQVVPGSTLPFLSDSTGALIVRDLTAAGAAANPNSSFVMGSAAGSVPVSTYVVSPAPTPSGVQSTWVAGQEFPVSTYSVSPTPITSTFPLGIQSTFAVAGSAKTSTHIASQTGPVSTFAVNKTSTHIVSQTGPVSTFTVSGPTSTHPQPSALGGLSSAYKQSLTTAAFQIHNGPAQLHQLWFTNTATSTRWLKFYDAGAVTVGTTPPNFVFGLPAVSTFSNAVSGFMPSGPYGIQFNTSTFVAATAQQATSDATAPGSNEVTFNAFYKS